MELQIEEPTPHVLILKPCVEHLDALVAGHFRERTGPLVAGKLLVILDLDEVSSIDSSGLGALVALLRAVPAGCHVRLANVKRNVRALFGLTRIDRLFRVFGSVLEALIAYEGAACRP